MDLRKSLYYIEDDTIHVFAFPPKGDERKAIVAPLLEEVIRRIPVSLDPSNQNPDVIVGVSQTNWAMIGEDVLYVGLNIVPYQLNQETSARYERILRAKGFCNMDAVV